MQLGKKNIPSDGHVCGKTTDEVRSDIHVQAKIPQKTLTQFQKFKFINISAASFSKISVG